MIARGFRDFIGNRVNLHRFERVCDELAECIIHIFRRSSPIDVRGWGPRGSRLTWMHADSFFYQYTSENLNIIIFVEFHFNSKDQFLKK